MDILALLNKRSGIVADRHNNRVSVYLKGVAVLALDGNAALTYLAKRGLKVYGNVIRLEEIAKEAGVCKANALSCDKVVLHLDDSRLLAVQIKLVSYLTARKSAADNYHVLADLSLAEQEVYSLDSSVRALYGYLLRYGTRCDDYLVGVKRLYVGYFGVHIDGYGVL